MTKNPCENCVEPMFAKNRAKRMAETQAELERAEQRLGQCGVKEFFNGTVSGVERRIRVARLRLDHYLAVEPSLEDIEDCAGPFKRINDTDPEFKIEESVCGARVQDHISGHTVWKPKLDNDPAA